MQSFVLYARHFDDLGWFFTTVLLAYALQHAWPAMRAVISVRWIIAGMVFAMGLYMAIVIVRGQERLIAMGRGLRPAGSRSAPFRGAQWLSRPGLAWFAAWFGGVVLLLALLRS